MHPSRRGSISVERITGGDSQVIVPPTIGVVSEFLEVVSDGADTAVEDAQKVTVLSDVIMKGGVGKDLHVEGIIESTEKNCVQLRVSINAYERTVLQRLSNKLLIEW
jgi:hypothetical protein